ncbi:MAG: hypothetical protein DRP09_10585 [Candidatus Thorarchaeota archaeon]|nr:MAG: hypothetical protein DRP09_10585 [Candidatus Thorarchaeota archaeon]
MRKTIKTPFRFRDGLGNVQRVVLNEYEHGGLYIRVVTQTEEWHNGEKQEGKIWEEVSAIPIELLPKIHEFAENYKKKRD